MGDATAEKLTGAVLVEDMPGQGRQHPPQDQRLPVRMARAFGMAVAGGREAHLAGRIPKLDRAEPSSPQLGLIGG